MLTILRRIVLEFSQASELDQALLCLVSQVKEALGTQCCSLYLADHQKQHFLPSCGATSVALYCVKK